MLVVYSDMMVCVQQMDVQPGAAAGVQSLHEMSLSSAGQHTVLQRAALFESGMDVCQKQSELSFTHCFTWCPLRSVIQKWFRSVTSTAVSEPHTKHN